MNYSCRFCGTSISSKQGGAAKPSVGNREPVRVYPERNRRFRPVNTTCNRCFLGLFT